MADEKQQPAKIEAKKVLELKAERQLCCARFSPCGQYLIGGGYDAQVWRWRVVEDKLEPIAALEGHHGWVGALAFAPSPDAATVYTGDSWGALRAWPYGEDAPKPRWSIDAAHDGWLRALSVSLDGKLIATCGRDQMVRVWSASDGKPVKEFKGHEQDVYAVAFAPDGKLIVSGDERGVLKVWDVESGKPVRDLDGKTLYKLDRIQDVGGLRLITFDAEGKHILAAGTTPANGATVQGVPTILVFDAATGELKHTMKHGEPKDGHVIDLYPHLAGYCMAVTTGVPGNGRFYFHKPGEEKPFFETNVQNCHALAAHPDGKRFAVVATNGGSNGNGRNLDKEGKYPGNFSPIFIFEVSGASA